MSDEPARALIVARRTLFWLAWLLLALSLLIPAPTGTTGASTLGGSALNVYAQAIAWSEAAPGSPGSLGLLRVTTLALALYSHVMFIIMPYMLRVRSVSAICKGFLVVLLAIDISVWFLVPELARLPAYWVWLASIASLVIAFVVFPGEGVPASAKSRKNPALVDQGELSPFVWVLLGVTLFWVAVSAANHVFPTQDRATAAANAPLTAYVNDRAKLLTADEASSLNIALQSFEAGTPNQIAVAIYPRVPAGSIDEFTIGTADRSRLGGAGFDTGAILFVFMTERLARLEVGYGLEGALTDAEAHHILESALVPAFVRGAYFDGLDATLKAIFAKVQYAYKRDGPPGALTLWGRQVKAERPNRMSTLWQTVSEVGLVARIGISFLVTFVGLILWSAVPQWGRLARDLARGVGNLLARRPFRQGMESIDANTIVDSVKLLLWTLGILIPAAAVILVAGGGAFGGAGSLIRW
jgi:uncharacterized membrane protein YgcG